MRGVVPAAVVLALALLPAACGRKSGDRESAGRAPGEKLVVYTSFYPLYAFARSIGGQYVEVVNPVPESEDPGHWMPSREIVGECQERADLIVINGAEFETWLDKVSLPEERVVNTSESFAGDYIVLEAVFTHSHGKTGKISYLGIDGHTWMDPHLARRQAESIKEAFISRDPLHQEEFEDNFRRLSDRFAGLDKLLTKISGKWGDRVLITSHPAYSYLARRYQWELKSFDFDPGQLPSPEAAGECAACVRRHGVKYLIWKEKPAEEVAIFFKDEIGVESVVFSPLETGRAEEDDYFLLMRQNIKNLERIFTPES